MSSLKYLKELMDRHRRINTQWLKERGLLKCEICGYDRCTACIEGHHIYPHEKENRSDSLGKWIVLSFERFYQKITSHHIQFLCRN